MICPPAKKLVETFQISTKSANLIRRIARAAEDGDSLEAVIGKFDGGPVGIETLAAALAEQKDTVEDVIEPYLLQQGFIQRTPRGRMLTPRAYEALGFKAPFHATVPLLENEDE